MKRPGALGDSHSPAAVVSSLSSPLFRRPQFTPMAERFPGDGAAANGFGRRHLHEDEARLLYEAEHYKKYVNL